MGNPMLNLKNASGAGGLAFQPRKIERLGTADRTGGRLKPRGRKGLTRYPCTKNATVCFVERVSFAEKYELCDQIGSGAYGTVFRAQDRVSGNWLAVKEVVTGRKSRAGRNEATILSALGDSPAVVQLMDFAEEMSEDNSTKTSRLVMDFCGGGNLEEFVESCGPLSADQAWAVATEVLRAIEHCHVNRICHADVKAANFLIDTPAARCQLQSDPAGLQPGWLKLVDMGTARVVGLGACSELLGTPTHWSPEVFGRKYSFPVDLWACGTTIHKLVTGSMPFWSEEEEKGMREQTEILRKTLLANRDFGELERGCGSRLVLVDLVKNMLSVDPSQRASARDGLQILTSSV
ncbi:hypothetical protein BSKO_10325 [Bryopsis sp. KO-2023]|nr:hypothetical protein BSKO_10325 [Bryopsis sp. KO-2023]